MADDMKPIKRLITIAVFEGNDYTVSEGDLSVDRLCWDEMLGQVAQLTMPNPPRLYPMLTNEQHEQKKRRHEERMAELGRERGNG